MPATPATAAARSPEHRPLEHPAQGQVDAEGGADAGDELGGEQRVPADREEVVLQRDLGRVQPEHLRPERGHPLLDRRARRQCRLRARGSGAGRAARSTLPCAVTGSRSSSTKAAGIM